MRWVRVGAGGCPAASGLRGAGRARGWAGRAGFSQEGEQHLRVSTGWVGPGLTNLKKGCATRPTTSPITPSRPLPASHFSPLLDPSCTCVWGGVACCPPPLGGHPIGTCLSCSLVYDQHENHRCLAQSGCSIKAPPEPRRPHFTDGKPGLPELTLTGQEGTGER